MSTVHARIQVTPDDALVDALARAAERWPGASRSELVLRLALEGSRALARADAKAATRRRAAIDRLRARFDGLYQPDELTELRADWPA